MLRCNNKNSDIMRAPNSKRNEHGRKQIINNPDIGYTEYSGYWGYFEQCHLPNSTAYSFRISGADMNKLEDMAQSTYNDLFEEAE